MKIILLERFELRASKAAAYLLSYPNTWMHYDQFANAEAAQEQVEKTV
jgi:hypothetical protein